MLASEAIRAAIDSGSEVNAEGAYLIALEAEKAPKRQSDLSDGRDRGR